MTNNFDTLKLTAKRMEILNRLELDSIEQILRYYPYRYDIFNDGPYHQWANRDMVYFKCIIISRPYTYRYGHKKSITKFKVESDDQILEISIFNRPWVKDLDVNNEVYIFGQFVDGVRVNLISYSLQANKDNLIQPQYSLKSGITNKQISAIVDSVFKQSVDVFDVVPQFYREKYQLLPLKQALYQIHKPSSKNEIAMALRTLKYEEFLKFNLVSQMAKANIVSAIGVCKIFDENKLLQIINALPFELTSDQMSAINDIITDLKSPNVMYRLIQGDVGCGKTIVATLALYANALANYQGAMLVPTEILAKQHFKSIKQLIGDGLNVECLYSSMPTSDKNRIIEQLTSGQIDIIVGTNAIFQDEISFNKLGLVITDEQHRFGVKQRKKLINKGDKVDFLLMSATPIPRTLATTIYGDMSISIIKSMPSNRTGCVTKIVNTNSITTIKDQLMECLNNGQQVYIVCNAIEKGELNVRSATDIYDKLLQEDFFKPYRLGLLHGKMDNVAKDLIMDNFVNHLIDVLICTTVIEVGVSVDNATSMVIYDAGRFGLSQLHQLRGRVMRGYHLGHCYLMVNAKDENNERLAMMEKTLDGFEIAEYDLKLRGPGDILGQRQSGLPSLILGDLIKDDNIFNVSRCDAIAIIQNENDFNVIKEYINNILMTNVDYID